MKAKPPAAFVHRCTAKPPPTPWACAHIATCERQRQEAGPCHSHPLRAAHPPASVPRPACTCRAALRCRMLPLWPLRRTSAAVCRPPGCQQPLGRCAILGAQTTCTA
eukprot:6192878-Prymnesium_polylepis.2